MLHGRRLFYEMAKVVLLTITNLETSSAADQINQNFTELAAQIEDALSRTGLNYDGTTVAANEMIANLDMNNYRVLNLPAPSSASEPARHGDIQSYVDAAQAAQLAAETAKTGAETAETGAQTAWNAFQGRWLGELAADPSVDALGAPVGSGDLFYSSTDHVLKTYDVEDVYAGGVAVVSGGVSVLVSQWVSFPINTLANISDLLLAGLADGDLLQYKIGVGKWENFRLTIAGADDVDTTTTPPNNGDVLTWVNADGKWEPAAPTGGPGSTPVAIPQPAGLPGPANMEWGTTTALGANFHRFKPVFLPAGAVITGIQVPAQAAGTPHLTPGLYADGGSGPSTLLASGPTVTSVSVGINNLPLTTPYTVPSNMMAWACVGHTTNSYTTPTNAVNAYFIARSSDALLSPAAGLTHGATQGAFWLY